jgi:aminoglycoside phosphotransferase (APT) family kinase protein
MLNPKFTILAVVLSMAGNVGYIIETYRGRIRPNRVTWTLWSLPPLIAFAAQVSRHVGGQAALTFACGLGALGVVGASFRSRGTGWKVTPVDLLCGALSLLCLAAWGLTGSPEIAILLAILTDAFPTLPTAIKAFRDPGSESKSAFLLFALSGLITLLTVKQWNLANYAYPAYILVLGSVILALIVLPRRRAAGPAPRGGRGTRVAATAGRQYARPMIRPAPALLRWAAEAVFPGARVAAVRALRGSGPPWLIRFEVTGRERTVVVRTADAASAADRSRCATEAAALAIAHRHVPAPRLLAADLDGDRAGQPALVISQLPGSSRIPRVPSPARLYAVGAAAARLHRIELPAQADLPLRERPIAKFDFAAGRAAAGVSTVLDEAEAALREVPAPTGRTTLVHGDFWQGNTMWVGNRFAGLVDWDCAGAGLPELDLGSLRLDAALLYGPGTGDAITEGWQDRAGRPARRLAHWDLVAALSTPVDMLTWMPAIHEEGRPDLHVDTVRERRDAFVREALKRLDSESDG